MLKGLILIMSLGLVVWGGRFFLMQKLVPPCSQPILYSVESFDRRFGVSYEGFLRAITEAESLWESALSGKELFTRSEEGGTLSINLIYDERQAVTQELSQLEEEVEEGQEGYDRLKARYQALKRDYEGLKLSYDALTKALEEQSDAYDERVASWNNGPRNSKSEFEALEAERKALEAEVARVKSVELELNRTISEINTLVGRLNRLAKELNLSVEEYNSLGGARGETFTGGLYESDAEGERINIYEFENHEKLVRVLAHELGHALGLDHVGDTQAIMYYLNQGERSRLTNADLEALKSLCKTN
jgi:predicted Zn-dependent protease